MIRLHYSNRFDELVPPLADAVAQSQARAPLGRVVVIVPNRVIEDYLKLRLSERLGVAANIEFPFLRGYLARLVNKADPALSVLEIDDLEMLLFERLRAILRKPAAGFEAVRAYVHSGSGSKPDEELRTLQLAGQVARMFREYSISRREMLTTWRTGTLLADSAFSTAESWQRALWQSIFEHNGAVRKELTAQGDARRLLLPDAFDAVAEQALRRTLPPALHVFGSGYAGPAFARIFAQIAALTELHVYALNPCAEFWDDIDIPGGADRERLVRRGSRVGAKLESEPDPFEIDGSGDTPALRLWSRPGREYVRLLNELSDCDFDPHFAHPLRRSGASLLHQVQEDILVRAPQRQPAPKGEGAADDGSIRFLACPGIRREAEIIANQVWSLVRASADLRFHEIAVAVPDRLWPDYQPHLETAFSELHQLPVNMVSRRFASESRIAQAIAMLLRLPLGNFGRYEMLHLLSHPALGGGRAEADTGKWAEWCDALGVFFGADSDDLKDTYLPPDLFHWDQALTRLALGSFMADERSAEARLFHCGSAQYLPLELAQDEIAGAARMLRLARGLIADAAAIRAQALTLGEWARALTTIVSTYITCADAIDERVRDWCVAAIESIAVSSIRTEPVLYQTAYELASARIAEAESVRGRFAETGVAIGPLSALRSLPFRAIFLAGLNEAQFPERPRQDPLDLRLAQRRAGDVTPTSRDRYQFLETLLAARERIFLCYVARDAQTGETREPSTVVRELQFILRGYLDADTLKKLTIEHPVSRYSFRYFPDIAPEKVSDPLESFDPNARRGAEMAALRAALQEHCGAITVPGREARLLERVSDETRAKLKPVLPIIEAPRAPAAKTGASKEIWLPLSALRKFLECPIQGAALYALGMSDDEDGALQEDLDEPLAQSRIDRAILLREAFQKSRGSQLSVPVEYTHAFRIAQARGRAPAGLFADATQRADLARLNEWFAQAALAGAGDLSKWIEVRIGHAGESARADRVLDEIKLEVTDRSGAQVTVRLHGSAGLLSPGLDKAVHGILRHDAYPKDFLRLFLPAIALSAAGQPVQQFHAIVVADAGENRELWIKRFNPPSSEHARTYLSMLARELLYGANCFFIPFEAVEEILRRRAKDPEADALEAIEAVREREIPRPSSFYGPVRKACEFDAPAAAEVERIISARFAPLMGIFDSKGELIGSDRVSQTLDTQPDKARPTRAGRGKRRHG